MTPAPAPKPETTPAITGDIHARMVGIMREIGAIAKSARNQAQGFNYRGIDDVYNSIQPILAKYGVYMTAEILSKTREERTNQKGTVLAFTCLRMRYRFHAEDGTSVPTEAEGEGMDSGDKSSNKGMAVGHKYALLQAFCIPTKELDDPDAHSHEIAASKRPEPSGGKPADVPDTDPDGQVTGWCDQQKAFIAACEVTEFLRAWKKRNDAALGRLEQRNLKAHTDLMDHYVERYDNLSQREKA